MAHKGQSDKYDDVIPICHTGALLREEDEGIPAQPKVDVVDGKAIVFENDGDHFVVRKTVWRTLAKNDIPDTHLPGNPPAVAGVAGCTPTLALTCDVVGGVAGPGGTRVYYQVRVLCGGSEDI